MESYSFRLPWPPSVNNYWRQGPRGTYLTKQGRDFREEAIKDIKRQLGSFEPIRGRVAIGIELVAPDRRKRDIDNHNKAPIDAIMHSGLIEDDEQMDQLITTRKHVESPGCCDVVLTVIGE